MLLAVMLSTESESDAHILDGTFDKILARKAGVSNPTVKRIVDTNEGQPQMQTELPISAENKSKANFSPTPIAPNDVTRLFNTTMIASILTMFQCKCLCPMERRSSTSAKHVVKITTQLSGLLNICEDTKAKNRMVC